MGGILGYTVKQAGIKNFAPKLYRDKDYIISYWKWILGIVYFFSICGCPIKVYVYSLIFEVWLTLQI